MKITFEGSTQEVIKHTFNPLFQINLNNNGSTQNNNYESSYSNICSGAHLTDCYFYSVLK